MQKAYSMIMLSMQIIKNPSHNAWVFYKMDFK